MHHLGRSHSTAIEGDRHETRTDDFSRRSGLGLRHRAATRQRACRERLQAVSATCCPIQASDPSPGASQNRAARRHDDLRDGTARRVSQALLPDPALRGVGSGRSRSMARGTTPRIGDRRLAQSTSAGCSSTPHPTSQAPNSAWMNRTTFSCRSFERSGQPDRRSAGARVGLGRRFDSGRFGLYLATLTAWHHYSGSERLRQNPTRAIIWWVMNCPPSMILSGSVAFTGSGILGVAGGGLITTAPLTPIKPPTLVPTK